MFDLQPILQNEKIRIEPLQPDDFERLYAIASDPLLWAQHPNKDRYKRAVFEVFFKEAIASGGAFVVIDKQQKNRLAVRGFTISTKSIMLLPLVIPLLPEIIGAGYTIDN